MARAMRCGFFSTFAQMALGIAGLGDGTVYVNFLGGGEWALSTNKMNDL